jgi:hypothetical protein
MDHIYKEDLIGNWTFIENDSSYGEIYINDKCISFFTDADGDYGKYNYGIYEDSLKFYFYAFKISFKSSNEITLESNYKRYHLERININSTIQDTTFYNPYYLRRCNYLVEKGEISMKEAISFLCNLSTIPHE